jgi:hypothetical protein
MSAQQLFLFNNIALLQFFVGEGGWGGEYLLSHLQAGPSQL